MLIIQKNASTNVICTVSDAVTVTGTVYFLFVLWSKTTGNTEYKFISSDISPFPERYNEFAVEEGPSGDFNAPVGDYYYKIIQKTESVTTYTVRDIILEQGIVRLVSDNPLTTGAYSYLKNYGATK